ncbi:uncharacterized protein LOC113234585 [Hyposmocoma kahamanoa]|uniref:uncharacterized protein LOC113234585 n=1 Tax=Hyposmocoma kahamanoa TaxID=1477025 RepID=UPI000E6D9B6F|nr:uncharacterized protein LOC113234585 [Hyposmocoma kahamanoa]
MPKYKDNEDLAEASKKKKTVRQSIKDIFVSKNGTKTNKRDDDSDRKSNNKVPKDDRFNMNNLQVCIEQVEVDNRSPWSDNESDGLQPEISCGCIVRPSRFDTESPNYHIASKITGTYCVQRVELDNTLRMSQKESDILHPSSNGGSSGTGTEMPIAKKSSKLSKIGSIISQKGSAISRKISKISHKSPKIIEPDDIQSEFSVFLDTILPDSKFKTPPFKELNDRSAKNADLSTFDEYDETKSADTSDNKALK